jgi:WS/DGAT/MGAT family acyltransferase
VGIIDTSDTTMPLDLPDLKGRMSLFGGLDSAEADIEMLERLSRADRIMLWADEGWPQDIGALVILDGEGLFADAGRFRIETVRQVIESRLWRVPRFRQILFIPPRGQGGPLWIDDPGFDLEEHVGVFPLPEPADESSLLLVVEQLRKRPLERTRPLWEMWLLPGLPGGKVAVYARLHHTLADGLAGMATLAAFLDPTPSTPDDPTPAWDPAPTPTPFELFIDNMSSRARAAGTAISALVHPVRTWRKVREAWPATKEIFAAGEVPASSLDRVVGADRSVAVCRSTLETVKDIAHGADAKVNDVLLTAVAGGLRELLSSRGEPVEGVTIRATVPVTLRHGDLSGATGNQIALMMVPLPIGVAAPVDRLDRIAAETARRKKQTRPSLGVLPNRGRLGRFMLKKIREQRLNLTTADLIGPPVPLRLAGSRVLEVFPLLPLIGNVSLGVGAMSYAGQFNITAVADGDAYPDLEVFMRGVRNELNRLESLIESPV